ncbi:hypothetical protein V1478_017878 [Vespula squamosa]|uniref:Uncharacterized protein n=1 Tax=Vespula squamosa TaxID=30214 RepID=A0ABD1ZY12_VESSQ
MKIWEEWRMIRICRAISLSYPRQGRSWGRQEFGGFEQSSRVAREAKIARRDQLWFSESGVSWEVNQPAFLSPFAKGTRAGTSSSGDDGGGGSGGGSGDEGGKKK